ncbi:MAG TPA: 4a-hydroxytetrahydrobiopterin dehydratase [Planctomycetota bacterium]
MTTPPLPEHCAPCTRATPALDPAAARARHALVPDWTLDFPRLRRTFHLSDFRAALAWTNRVGMLAEEEQHHPDFHLTGWNQLELVLWTHVAGGLTDNDFVLARRIDELWARR